MAQHFQTRGLFITGTDTDVGKTYVSCRLIDSMRAQGLSVGAYKPVCSGVLPTLGESGTSQPRWHDVEELWEATGNLFPRKRLAPQCFRAPLAPPLAAALEGKEVSPPMLREGAAWWHGRVEWLVVEGAGGIFAPISQEDVVLDLAADLGYPILIVARPTLGTINHTLLTIAAIRHRSLAVSGVVFTAAQPFDSVAAGDNARLITELSGVPVIATLHPGQPWPVDIASTTLFANRST